MLYAKDVELVAAFYARLDFQEHFRLSGEDGSAGYIGLRRDHAELAVTTEDSPRMLAGVEPGLGPQHELFVYVDDVDRTVSALRAAGTSVLREPINMPGVSASHSSLIPRGNVVSLATRWPGAA